jgi:crotonobetainyl-CoA:carnitine CoA-transferase CaiB-like acyl-CoA transferase
LADDPRANRAGLVARLSAWTRTQTPVQAAAALQAAGIAAGPMNRPADLLDDPQLVERKLLRDMVHPLIAHPLPTETGPAPFRHIPPAPQRPAPLPGQHTRDICRDVLGMGAEETLRLIADGALFESTVSGKRGTGSMPGGETGDLPH